MDDVVVSYTINSDSIVSDRRIVTARAILEAAGFTPAELYVLRRVSPPEDFHGRYDALVSVGEHDEFHALYIGPTYSA